MKTQIKRLSKSTLSVIMAICMLISCMTVGLIATDAARVADDSAVGWNSSTDFFHIQQNNGGWSNVSFSTGGKATFTVASDNTKIEFELVFNGTVYKLDSSQSGFTAAGIRTSTGTTRLAKTSGSSTYSVSGVYAGTYTVQLNGTPSNGEQSFTISGSGSSTCSTNKKYIVTGSSQLTNTSGWQSTWSGATSRNQFVYDNEAQMYKLEYSNIAANSSSSDRFRFRILDTEDSDTWETTMGYDQGSGAISDTENLLQYNAQGSDNTFEFSLKAKANITIYFNDADLSSNKAITVIITPAVSTVTAAASPSAGGSATVNGSSSASGVNYEAKVSLVAAPAANYHFNGWTSTNGKLSFTDASAASTEAVVYGTDTATANFEPNSFSITRASDNYEMTVNGAAKNTSAQYTSNVTVSATPADGYIVDSIWYSTDGGATKTTIASSSSGSFTMPASSVTVGAVVHQAANHVVNYGIVTGCEGMGYVTAGERYDSDTHISRTIDTGSSVYESVTVNFGARPAVGYKFVGWYSDQAGNTQLSTSQDYSVEGPSGGYYAKFEADSNIASSGIRIYVNKANNKNSKVWIWNTTSPDFSSSGIYGDRPSLESFTGAGKTEVTIGNTVYYRLDFPNSSSINFRLGTGEDSMTASSAGTYVIESYSGGSAMSAYSTTAYYPAYLYVTNPDKGTTYITYFRQAGANEYVHYAPTDSDNWKTTVEKKQNSTVIGTETFTTGTQTTITMPSGGTSVTATVTYVEKDYYPVVFAAGPNGSVKASTGSSYSDANKISSGTLVKEGTSVTFVATANSGYSFDSWVGASTTSSSFQRTINSAADVTAYFKYNDNGTQTSENVYFVYNTAQDFHTWTGGTKVYIKNGHAYGYINNPTQNTRYYFAVSSQQNPSTATSEGNGRGLYHWNNSDLKVSNDFTYYLSASQSEWKFGDDGTAYYGNVTSLRSSVSKIIVDLGEWKGTYVSGDYRVIPVYDTSATNVDIYAKDGTYRGDNQYDFFPGIADTVLTGASNIQHNKEFDTGAANRGDTITVTTTIDSAYRGTYYVKGFSFNGVTPELYEYSSGGVYSCTYKIPDNFAYDYLEITPIYYIKDATAVEFYIENYDEAFQNTGWGNTLSVYPYYFVSGKDDVNQKDNAFGGYPGQPVIYYGGRRFIQIPTSYTMTRADRNYKNSANYPEIGSTAIIKGITLSNDYWDIVHREYVREVDTHMQTYDYDDFYKIYKETNDGNEVNGRQHVADQITFAFKYRTSLDNFGTTRYSAGGTMPSSITKSSFTNGWEEYLDYHDRPIDVFGKILTTEEQAKDPLLIVSNGYEYTHAGYYATTWTIYTPDGSTKIGTITPSALEISSASRLTNTSIYPNSSGRTDVPNTVVIKQLSAFQTTYNALKANYTGTPALITYEKELSNQTGETYYTSWGERSNRSDGRWYYSYMGEAINASLRIEYSNDNGETFTVDPYKTGSNTGSVTGATVMFTNRDGDSDGSYELYGLKDTKDYNGEIVSNTDHYYKFLATPAPGYVFAGWWFERDGIVTDVNSDHSKLDGKSQMTSNAVFVARYVKAPTGTLTVNHTLSSDSVGSGSTYVAVKAVNKSTGAETWLTGAGTEADHFTAEHFAVDNNYVSYKSGYRFEITLKTVTTNQFTEFDRFSAVDDGHSPDYFNSDATTSGTTTTSETFSVDVDDLFEIGASGFPEQTIDTLSYLSHLKSASYEYELNYSYGSYDNLYGTQGYTVRGTFDYDELNDYMTLSGSTLTFKATEGATNYKVNFLNLMAPYEDNFMQTIGWNSSTATESFANNKLTVTITPNPSATTINLTFVFPYQHDTFENKYAPVETGGKVMMQDDEEVPVTPSPAYNTLFSFNDVKTYDAAGEPEVLEAPAVIYNGDQAYIFRYWSVTTVPDAKHNAVEYTRGYSQSFNLVLFQDSVVKPVYTIAANENDTANPSGQQKADTSMGITISFIENSRNQYNEHQSGTISSTSTRYEQGDRIYSDFLLSYNNIAPNQNGEPIMLKSTPAGQKFAGLIVETVGDIDRVDGKYVTKTEAEYKSTYGANLTEISEKLSGDDGSGNVITVDREQELKDFISSGDTAQGNFLLSEFDVRKLDNKNRIQYYYSLPNRSHADLSDTERRIKVYRAYAYIRNSDNSEIQISQVPVYFTIYDIGSIQNYTEATQTGGYQS